MPFQVGSIAVHDDVQHTGSGSVATHAALDVAAAVHPNAKTHIDAAAPHSGHLQLAFVPWAGNSSGATRNIAHSVSATPKFIILVCLTTNAEGGVIWFTGSGTSWTYIAGNQVTMGGVDGTNFTVGNAGNSFNLAGRNYQAILFY